MNALYQIVPRRRFEVCAARGQGYYIVDALTGRAVAGFLLGEQAAARANSLEARWWQFTERYRRGEWQP